MKLRLALAMLPVLLFAAPVAHAQQPQEGMMIARACGNDIDRLCPGVPPGQGRIKACMKAHISQLSAPCFDTLLSAIAAQKEPH